MVDNGYLPPDKFLTVVENAPLVAIDIVVVDTSEKILMGKRVNEPARNRWFVPGGRIRKDETLDAAFARIAKDELGQEWSRADATLLGAFTHKYENNALGVEAVTTHYVVLAYEVRVHTELSLYASSQHSEYRWISSDQMNEDVHPNAAAYIDCLTTFSEAQYQALNSRRDTFNELLWQTPALSLTAQAFLLTIILSPGSTDQGQFIASVLALVTAGVSLQLLLKHRFMEVEYARLLTKIEKSSKQMPVNARYISDRWFLKQSSYRLWAFALTAFMTSSLGLGVLSGFRLFGPPSPLLIAVIFVGVLYAAAWPRDRR